MGVNLGELELVGGIRVTFMHGEEFMGNFESVMVGLSECWKIKVRQWLGVCFFSGLDLLSMNLSYSVKNLNGSFSGFEEHSVIESCFSLVCSQYLGGNLN